jgi:hypothetical protein
MKTSKDFVTAAIAAVQTVTAASDPALCPGSYGQIHTSSCGAKWVVECDVDHSGGDLPLTAQYVASLQQCIEVCQSNGDCVDVSWILVSPKGACYLKGDMGPTRSDRGIWTGRQISGCVVASPVTQNPALTADDHPAALPTSQAPEGRPSASVASKGPAEDGRPVVSSNAVPNGNPREFSNQRRTTISVLRRHLLTCSSRPSPVRHQVRTGTRQCQIRCYARAHPLAPPKVYS